MPKKRQEFVPITPFQKWLHPALERRGIDIADLARLTNADYTHLWKIAAGDPKIYKTSTRPGYALTKEIGKVLGDERGALVAAGHEEEDNTEIAGVMGNTAIEYVPDPDEEIIISSYRGASPPNKHLLKRIAEEIRQLERDHTIGGNRAE